MTNFKVGDKIICAIQYGTIQEGDIYQIVELDEARGIFNTRTIKSKVWPDTSSVWRFTFEYIKYYKLYNENPQLEFDF